MRYLPEYFQRQIALCGFLTVVALPIGCGTSKPAGNDNEGEVASCTEPSNPFSEGTGHYAGYEWAEKNGSGDCNGSSQSFREGCEEYEAQESAYDECQKKKH
ncbi:MAG: hypothetical protein DMG37_06405 [Acidobacteria bacterium]|nr:MAG: hypothetical protein DMG37_06405 [Acidobacteriota bacterium]